MDIFEFWSRLGPLNVHPDDQPILSAWERHWGKCEVDLTCAPEPFSGCLKTAPVVICVANPNPGGTEARHNDFLRKKLMGNTPLLCDPRDKSHEWFAKLLADINKDRVEELSRLVAVLDLVPYRSDGFRLSHEQLSSALPSSDVARRFLRECLISDALLGKRFVVVLRQCWHWSVYPGMFPDCRSLVIHPPDRALRQARLNFPEVACSPSIGERIWNWLVCRGYQQVPEN